jgi:tetratricopeptide (TPR) repeat protein
MSKLNRETCLKPLRNALSLKKEWAFRIVAAFVVPAFTLAVVELGLRWVGVGYATGFFIPSEKEQVFAENPRFGWRFFPKDMARAPDPIRLTKIKPAQTYRIFVFGESAALGDPEPAYGFSRIMRELLEEKCPGVKFEIINVAMTAINSHTIRDIARDCVPFSGDIWIIYMGNNEVVGPYGAGSVFGLRSPPYWMVRASLAVKRTRIGQLLDELLDQFQRKPGSRQWKGMQMMVNQQIHAADPSLERVYRHFDRNLNDIVSTAARSGVKPIVCSVASNLKDCPPFASVNRVGLSREQKADWASAFSSGKDFEARRDHGAALAQYARATQVDDTFAELSFRMARCYLAMSEVERAGDYYARARDLDALRFRADTRINAIIRNRCARAAEDGVLFFDAVAAVTNLCPMGIPGAESLWDHVHFNFAGNYQLARGLSEHVLTLLPGVLSKSNASFLTEADCATRLAFTAWDQGAVLELMWQRVQRPPFVGQLDHDGLLNDWSARRAKLRSTRSEPELSSAIRIYHTALERRPEDWVLRHRLGFLLDAAGQLSEAERQWKNVVELMPGHVGTIFKLGDIASRQSKSAAGERYYREVLRLRPGSCEAVNGMGLLRMAEGKPEEAEQLFQKALRMSPGFAQAEVNLGLIFSQRGDLVKAEEVYRSALRNDPQSIGARVNLANLLVTKQEHAPAIELYAQALEQQPEQPAVHFALANSFHALGRHAEAIAYYRHAISQDPGLAGAHYNLGLVLAKEGDLRSATGCFQEAVRLRPEDSQARLNLGVALAKQNRLEEAVSQFKTVLQSDPNNATAKQYLDTATLRQGTAPRM